MNTIIDGLYYALAVVVTAVALVVLSCMLIRDLLEAPQ